VLGLFLTSLRPVVRILPNEDGLAIDGIGPGGVCTPGDGSLDHGFIQRRSTPVQNERNCDSSRGSRGELMWHAGQ
jgi:hypothetical protein